ncbi:hypothetical protein BGX34_000338 [Mortierella sp. NVP85]|nr:hypothetical protein BGX34_000338 [Mortierella sp. NVP85]
MRINLLFPRAIGYPKNGPGGTTFCGRQYNRQHLPPRLFTTSTNGGRPFLTSKYAYNCFWRRGITTLPDKRDPLLRYFGGNDEYVSPQEYRLRVGKAISTLREELPLFFHRGMCTTSIFAPNIRLIEASHTNVTLQGKSVYFLLAGTIRWSFRMWFRDLEFEIQSIRVNDRGGRGLGGMDSGHFDNTATHSNMAHLFSKTRQPLAEAEYIGRLYRGSPLDFTHRHRYGHSNSGFNPDLAGRPDGVRRSTGADGTNEDQQPTPPATTVTVRWTMKGTTRPSVVLTSSGPALPPPSSYAGIFVYQFDERGLIDEHRIENIMPSPSPEAIQRAFAWWGWLLSRTRPAAAAVSDDAEARKGLGLGYSHRYNALT